MDDKTDTESEPEIENKQDVSDGESRPISKKSENCVWLYFNKLKPYNQKKAECKVCFKIYSYKTTTSNLKCHFDRKHANIVKDNEGFVGKAFININRLKSYRDSASKLKKSSSVNEQKLQYINLACDNDGNDSDDGVKLTSQIWSQFNHDDDQPTCNLCRELVSSRLEDLKNHLDEKHSGVLDHITAEAFDATSEGDLMADDTFTEVVYLEEEQNKVNKSKRTKYLQRDALNIQESNKRKRFNAKQRNLSESSEEHILKPKRVKTNSPDELEVFMNYFKVLLQKVPEENSLKLHLDIINLVMKATPTPQSLVAEKSISAFSLGTDTMQGKSRLNPKPKITDDKITPRLVTISTNTEPQPRFIINYKLQNES